MKVKVIPIVIGALGTVTKIIGTGTGGLGNKMMSERPRHYWIKIEISYIF